MQMTISVIIPSLNRPSALKKCLGSVLNQEKGQEDGYEAIVVLDHRDKESQDWLLKEAAQHKSLKIRRAEKPGVNAARNLGIKESVGRIIYFLDDDCILPKEDHVLRLLNSFKEHPEASAIGGGYILANTRTDTLAMARNQLDNFYIKSHIRNQNDACALLGGNTAYRKDAFARFGAFDENILYGSAETELNDRVLKGGGKLVYSNDLSVYHEPKTDKLRTYLIKSFKQGLGNGYSFIKNGPPDERADKRTSRFWFLPVAKTLDTRFPKKIIAILFLALNSIFYWTGYISARTGFSKTLGQKTAQ